MVSDQLRKAIEDSGLSIHAVGRGAGVTHPSILRFLSGERGLTSKSIDALCAFLGLELTTKATKTTGARGGKRR